MLLIFIREIVLLASIICTHLCNSHIRVQERRLALDIDTTIYILLMLLIEMYIFYLYAVLLVSTIDIFMRLHIFLFIIFNVNTFLYICTYDRKDIFSDKVFRMLTAASF